MPSTGKPLVEELRTKAYEEGFTKMGICRPDAIPQAARHLQDFVDQGYHGQMSWMAARMNWRGDPAQLWPEANSIIMLAEAYTPEHDPLGILEYKDQGAISVYAQNKDYHDIVKKRLKRVGRWLIEQNKNTEIKVFVDTAPVMEKPLAAAAGLGWQGKHTNVVSQDLGNWFFLGSIFTTLELEIDQAAKDHCGSCRSCLDICPTNAFIGPYKLDAKRCISYLTIEHKGPIAPELRTKLGNRIYGCDDCLAVCPWNKFAQRSTEIAYHARDELLSPKLKDLVVLDDAEFRKFFSKSPIKRIGRNQFVRNVLYAIGNSKDKSLLDAAQKLSLDPDPVVSDAANWATHQLKEK